MIARPGDSLDISARDWNDLRRMLAEWRGDRGGGLLDRPPPTPEIVWIKNTTSNDLAAFTVLGIDQPIFDLSSVTHEKYNGVRFKGVSPSTSTPHYGKFAVLQEPAKATDGFARAVIAGQTLVKLSVTNANDERADIENAVTATLKTGPYGAARILWKETGTGTKWGLVNIGSSSISFYRGITNMAINKGTNDKTVSRYKPGTTTDTGIDDTVTNEIANVGSGKVVYYIGDGANFYLVTGECPLT